jgi:hypothetical protein
MLVSNILEELIASIFKMELLFLVKNVLADRPFIFKVELLYFVKKSGTRGQPRSRIQ